MQPESDLGEPSNHPSKLPRTVWVLSWVSFFADVSSEIVYPLLPFIAVGTLGMTRWQLGSVEGAAVLLVALMSACSGILSDLGDGAGRRLFWIRIGYGMPILGKLLIAFATNGWLLAGGRLVDRFGKGLRGAPRDALLADVVSEEQRGRAFGLHRTLDTAGAMVGVIGAAVAISWFTNNAVGETTVPNAHNDFVYRSIVFFGAVLGVFSVALTWLIPTKKYLVTPSAISGDEFVKKTAPEFHTIEGEHDEITEVTTGPATTIHVEIVPYFADFVATLPKSYWRSIGVLCLFALANSSDAFLLLRATDMGFTPAGAVTLYALYNLVYAAFSYPIGALSDRLGRRIPMILGWIIYGVVYLGFALLNKNQAWAIWPLMASYGLYMAFTDGVGKAWIADLAPKHARGRSLGVYFGLTGLSTFAASLLMGIVWDRSGPFLAFVMGATIALFAAFALIVGSKGEVESASK